MKKVNKDPFSNGTEYMMFEDLCCSKCVKHSHMKKEGDTMYEDEYTNVVCSIERASEESQKELLKYIIQFALCKGWNDCFDYNMKHNK